MNINNIKPGIEVRTTKLGETSGIIVKDNKYLDTRQSGLVGTVVGYLPGHGGDVWYIQHYDTEDIGVYCFNEFELV
jgi:hypothetical protein